MKHQMKAISPIIAIIIILLITIAIAGAGYSYLSIYWTGLIGKQIQVLDASCYPGNQGKVTLKNIGTLAINTGDIVVKDSSTGNDISGDILWSRNTTDPSIVLEFRFEEGPGSTIAKDTSGQGNDGTLNGNPQWVDGKIGGALDFDGDYVKSPLTYDTGTISIWFKRMSNAPITLFSDDTGLFEWDFTGDFAYFSSGGKVMDGVSWTYNNNWEHLVIVHDGSIEADVYKNGQFVSTIDSAFNIIWGNGLYLGSLTGTSNYWDGTIDEVRFYNRALSPQEIEVLANNSVTLQPGQTAVITHTCTGRCSYSLVLPGGAKETMLEC